jgi:AcrR family transcriptional regulator
VSVREITAAAKCNLAAVNYHFGNKENLYLEVFRSRWGPRAKRIQECFRESLPNPVTKASLVKALAHAFLEGPLSDEERMRHHQLMAREMGQPSEAFKLVADQVMRPFIEELGRELQALSVSKSEQLDLALNLFSIFSQVLYFNFARLAVARITGREYDAAFKKQIVDHITAFSLWGLSGMDKEERR